MSIKRILLGKILVLLCVSVAVVGCPSAPDSGVAIVVSPSLLDFGASQTMMTFDVKKNYTSLPMSPFQVTSSAAWIKVSPSTGVSEGPKDPVVVNVMIDRDVLKAGTNGATITIKSQGAADQTVKVTAFRELTASFSVDEVQPFLGGSVKFTDLSQVAQGAGPIVSWLWDFGDGSTSMDKSPTHQYSRLGSFSVTLRTSTANSSATLTKTGLINVRVKEPPTAAFTVSKQIADANESVSFTDSSAGGTKPITSWLWSFGDGATSAAKNPSHAYTTPGSYTVTLSVTSEHGTDSEERAGYMTIEPVAPNSGFSVSNRRPICDESVQFYDQCQAGSSPVTKYLWDFGDGASSTQRNPSHKYCQPGYYTVALTVTGEDGGVDTARVADYLYVQWVDPDADFAVSRTRGVTVDSFEFTNETDPGSGVLIDYTWSFGDGASSKETNPVHTYANPGVYTVSLVAENEHGSDMAVKTGYVRVYATTALDRYVRKPDGAFSVAYNSYTTIDGAGYDAYVLAMTSQKWRETEVDKPTWAHWLTVIKPDIVTNDTALLFITGGSTSSSMPTTVPVELGAFAAMTGSIVAILPLVPNQPLEFTGDGGRARSEDEIIAYSFDKFMNSYDAGDPDEEWPVLLPMTKSAVRAMDVVQGFMDYLPGGVGVKDFVVSGASKRGWTTWLTAATDSRVVGVVPMVIDMLNMADSMAWHEQVYCGYSVQLQDYVDLNIMPRLSTEAGQALTAIVDPYSYTERYTIPKLGINATSDEFFLPDSAQFYVDPMKDTGPTYLRYMPNAGHSLSSAYPQVVASLATFHSEVVAGGSSLPVFDWTVSDEPDRKTITVTTETEPSAVTVWRATIGAAAGGSRDFRLAAVGDAAWMPEVLEPQTPGGKVYVADFAKPLSGWTGFFVELEFPNPGSSEPFVFTTEVQVVSSTVWCKDEMGGWGTIETVGSGVDAITLVKAGGTRYQMGYWYGRLLANQIAANWRTFSTLVAMTGTTETDYQAAIASMWNSVYFDTAAWEQELQGVADGCAMSGYPEITMLVLKKMLVIPDMSEYNCSLYAVWGNATTDGSMFQMRNLDWSMDLGVQDYPVVAMYFPDDGEGHAVIGFAGFLGVAGGGINEHGIALSEIMGHFCDVERLDGIPFPVLLRDVIYHDTNLADALTRMSTATRTNQYHYCVGDAGAPDPKARLLFTSATRFDEYQDNESVVGHPCVTPDPYHASLDDAVYWKNHNGRDNIIIYNAISSNYGSIDSAKAINIARACGVDGTVLSIVYGNTERKFWVAYADGPTNPAQTQNYVEFKLEEPAH